jgi:hypothetical protein
MYFFPGTRFLFSGIFSFPPGRFDMRRSLGKELLGELSAKNPRFFGLLQTIESGLDR